jgi:hypothetical protein
MRFGLCGAPSTYARMMNLVLRDLTWNIVLAFLDDILVMGKSFEDHMSNLRIVLDRFRHYGLKLKPAKCELFQSEVEFLGRKVNKTGIAIGDEYVETVRKWEIPKDYERG